MHIFWFPCIGIFFFSSSLRPRPVILRFWNKRTLPGVGFIGRPEFSCCKELFFSFRLDSRKNALSNWEYKKCRKISRLTSDQTGHYRIIFLQFAVAWFCIQSFISPKSQTSFCAKERSALMKEDYRTETSNFFPSNFE